jgi:hypothetical protein
MMQARMLLRCYHQLVPSSLRPSEVAALTLGHIQQRDNCWCIIDLVGKNGPVRTMLLR